MTSRKEPMPPNPSEQHIPAAESNRRAEAAKRRQELAQATTRAENKVAQKLITEFVTSALATGLPKTRLYATLLDGATVRTDKWGWYLRVNHSIAIGEDGGYYILVVPGGLRERLFGVKITASDPPLFIGKGGRDGETGELSFFLTRALNGEIN